MKQIVRCVIDRGGKVRLIDVPRPVCGSGEILISNEYSLISIGTEMQMAKMNTAAAVATTLKDNKLKTTVLNLFKSMKLRDFLRLVKEELIKGYPMGYSGSGSVIEVGAEVVGVNVGDKVAYGGFGHADIVKVPQNLFIKLPDNVDCSEGAFVTLGSIAMQGVRQSKLGFGEIVVVYGLGLVGLLTVQILNAYGFKIIGIDIDDRKIDAAYKYGAEKCFNATQSKNIITEKIMKYTNGYGVDGILICAAGMNNNTIVNHSCELARKRGRIVIIGKVGLGLERSEIYNKELELTISCAYGPGRYDEQYEKKGIDYPYGYVRWTENRNMQEFVDLIKRRKVSVKPFITDEVSIDVAEETYQKIQKDTNYNPVGVLIKYDNHKTEDVLLNFAEPKMRPSIHESLNVGLIGVGNFSRTMIMPNLGKSTLCNFVALSDNKGNTARQFGQQYKLSYVATNYKTLLEDGSIDVIYVATRHDTHQKISIEALKFGKSVICEKPMAMSYDELNELVEIIKESGAVYHVGFNRRYTGFARKVRSIINTEKVIIKVTVNNKKMNRKSWQLDPLIGGGRMIGEACHFFDLLNYLINSKPIYVYAAGLNDAENCIITNNNFVVTVTYKNGSVGQVIYSDLGTDKYPKERIEVHSNNSIVEIIDFKEMRIFGLKKTRIKKMHIDKGHFNQLEEVAKAILGKSSNQVPSLEDYYHASVIPLKAIDSMKLNKVMPI